MLVIRHPMQRIESLYSNKFTNKKLLKTTFKQNPFEFITRKIILSRKYNPGTQFNNSLTPNELVRYSISFHFVALLPTNKWHLSQFCFNWSTKKWWTFQWSLGTNLESLSCLSFKLYRICKVDCHFQNAKLLIKLLD